MATSVLRSSFARGTSLKNITLFLRLEFAWSSLMKHIEQAVKRRRCARVALTFLRKAKIIIIADGDNVRAIGAPYEVTEKTSLRKLYSLLSPR